MVVIPPDNKSVLLETNPHHNNHTNHFDGQDQMYRPTERVKDGQASALSQMLAQFASTVVSIEKNGAATALATEKTGSAGQLATEKTGSAGVLATERMGSASILATERVSAAAAAADAINFGNTQNILISGFKDGRFDAATLTASILQNQVSGFKDGRYDAATLAASILQSQVVGFKDGRYDAAVNAAATQKQMAECCCELKEKISAEGEATRALINSVDARRSDRELVDAKGEVTLLKLQLSARVPATVVV